MQIRGVCFDHLLLCNHIESHKKKFNSEKAILNHSTYAKIPCPIFLNRTLHILHALLLYKIVTLCVYGFYSP